MLLKEERLIDAPPGTVWTALMDPAVLKDSIPGCSELTGSREDGFDAVVTQKVGPVKATFRGRVEVETLEEGRSARLSGEGKGGPAGFAKGAATVNLTPSGAGTMLAYDAQANVGGKLAQLGGRVIDAFSKRLADQFFDNFTKRVEAGTAPGVAEASAAPTPTPAEPAATPNEKPKTSWLGRLLGRLMGRTQT